MVKVRFDVVKVLGMSGYLLTAFSALAAASFHCLTRMRCISAIASASFMSGL